MSETLKYKMHLQMIRCATMGATEREGAMSPEVMSEVGKALRLARRYGGRFGQDELEYAAALLGEELPYKPRPTQGYGRA